MCHTCMQFIVALNKPWCVRAGAQESCVKVLCDVSCDAVWHVQALILAYRMNSMFAEARLALHSYIKLRRFFCSIAQLPVSCRSCSWFRLAMLRHMVQQFHSPVVVACEGQYVLPCDSCCCVNSQSLTQVYNTEFITGLC